jgi:hypothetical protein
MNAEHGQTEETRKVTEVTKRSSTEEDTERDLLLLLIHVGLDAH